MTTTPFGQSQAAAASDDLLIDETTVDLDAEASASIVAMPTRIRDV